MSSTPCLVFVFRVNASLHHDQLVLLAFPRCPITFRRNYCWKHPQSHPRVPLPRYWPSLFSSSLGPSCSVEQAWNPSCIPMVNEYLGDITSSEPVLNALALRPTSGSPVPQILRSSNLRCLVMGPRLMVLCVAICAPTYSVKGVNVIRSHITDSWLYLTSPQDPPIPLWPILTDLWCRCLLGESNSPLVQFQLRSAVSGPLTHRMLSYFRHR